ncbi:MAG: hypothetical protein OEY25_10535 [Candidatus Aminicenantes bacterium]|nr:hypothetical protein [Candidatus Aminicenantes bacterium]MDH5705332.1 hypothetical protein [Candidatus Aminicenantes bacterium]
MPNSKRWLLLAAVAVAAGLNICIYLNVHLYFLARDRIEDAEKKVKALGSANIFYLSNDLVYYELGKAYFDLGMMNIHDKALSESCLRKSVQNFTRSLRINPASYFCHFNLAQALLYLSYITPDYKGNAYEEYKKAALLAGHNSQIYYEVGKIFLSLWPELSEGEKDFTLGLFKKILERKDSQMIQDVMQIWDMNVKDYSVMEEILPEDASLFQIYARFLGYRHLSIEERQKFLARAELLEFERARHEFDSGEREFQYYRLRDAAGHYKESLRTLDRQALYQNLTGESLIDIEEFKNLKKSVCLSLAKCLLEEGREFKEAVVYLREYLALEDRVSSIGELESYLRRRGLVKEELRASFDDLGLLSFQTLLYFKRNRYRDIMKTGRLLKQSFVVVPEEKRNEFVEVLLLVGDSFQKADYIYDAGEFYHKALDVEPGNLQVLLRIRQNYERLNEDEKVQSIDEKMEELLTPRTMDLEKPRIERGRKFSCSLNLDGSEILLSLHFENEAWTDFFPLISIFFNGRAVWENYLKDETEEIEINDDEVILKLSLKSKVGENSLVAIPLNSAVSLFKINYQEKVR